MLQQMTHRRTACRALLAPMCHVRSVATSAASARPVHSSVVPAPVAQANIAHLEDGSRHPAGLNSSLHVTLLAAACVVVIWIVYQMCRLTDEAWLEPGLPGLNPQP
jgi:hypothetical protein